MVNSQSDTTKLILGFVGIIITIVILASAADSTSLQTSTFDITNASATVGAVNVTVAVTGSELVGLWTVYNESNDVLWANNANTSFFTLDDGAVSGVRTVRLTPNQDAAGLVADTVNLSYTYGTSGYSTLSGTRSITNLIPIMAALAILVFSLMLIFSSNAGKALLGKFK